MFDRIKYFRRRQFVLGPEYLQYQGWKRIKLDAKFVLTVHPDLSFTIVENGDNKSILLGFTIDPYNIGLNDEGVLQRFVDGSVTLEKVINGLETLSGRFALIIQCPAGMWLFHDACALRQVNYCIDRNGAIWCASQAETLAEYFGYQYDKEILSYRDSSAYSNSREEFWLINDRTPYREIKYLLANHYLDLSQRQVNRFWPVAGCLDTLSVNESIRLSTPLLQNSIKAAANRFDLKMGMTAGSDSRRSLAAAKAVTEKIFFFTHTPRTDVADMEVPARLLPKLGIEHHQLTILPMTEEFRELYESSATWARERRGQIAYTSLMNFGPDATIFNSNLSEIHECWYWLPKSKINGEGLAIATRLNHSVAINEFQKWIDDAKPACDASGMNILVLFDYELRSRWAAAAFYEYDIAYETFNPYNNRHLSRLEMSIDERYRNGQRLDVLIRQIKYMWPEVLSDPINPEHNILPKVKQFILASIVHKVITPWFPLYQYLKYLKLKRQFYR
jgi:hypothetical protein